MICTQRGTETLAKALTDARRAASLSQGRPVAKGKWRRFRTALAIPTKRTGNGGARSGIGQAKSGHRRQGRRPRCPNVAAAACPHPHSHRQRPGQGAFRFRPAYRTQDRTGSQTVVNFHCARDTNIRASPTSPSPPLFSANQSVFDDGHHHR